MLGHQGVPEAEWNTGLKKKNNRINLRAKVMGKKDEIQQSYNSKSYLYGLGTTHCATNRDPVS